MIWKLADEDSVLITVKTRMQRLTEGLPRCYSRCIVDGFIPTGSVTLQIPRTNANPHRRINVVHIEILLTVGTPKARVLAIELVEWKFRKTTVRLVGWEGYDGGG